MPLVRHYRAMKICPAYVRHFWRVFHSSPQAKNRGAPEPSQIMAEMLRSSA
jgi:hypothetical protein